MIRCPKGKITDIKHYGAIADIKGKDVKYMKATTFLTTKEERKFGYNYCGDSANLEAADKCDIIKAP